MEETNVSLHLYSFLEATAVRYDEKPDKDGRCDIRDIEIRNVPCLTTRQIESTSRRPNRSHDTRSRNMSNRFPRKSILSILRDFNTYLLVQKLKGYKGSISPISRVRST